ncbi:hypothetical protein PR048_002970 [Dryococelus australis]|uniref:Uncharacterized protein n=1 Tax=Dryococelus australis TaxID=614101 RepID=A0ABQ9IMT0_9NEOP|nr:hypothetical protein PR048_002970 [Dryococelus australis]
MSDNESAAVDEPKRKRGRPSKGASDVKESKKRGRTAADDKKELKKADGASPAKRGRGRPKGSTKKKGAKAAPKIEHLFNKDALLLRYISKTQNCDLVFSVLNAMFVSRAILNPSEDCSGQAVSSLASHQGNPGSIPNQVPGFSHVGISLDDAVGRGVFSGISYFPRSFISALLHTLPQLPSSALKTSLLTAI